MSALDPLDDPTAWNHAGARALVRLHDRYLRECLEAWRRAALVGVRLPATEDPAYASLEALLSHVLRAARGYLLWCCRTLGREAPDLAAPPASERLASEASAYLEELLTAWKGPLRELTEEEAVRTVADSNWGVPYCVDAMLEHAVAHPLRHALQLDDLVAEQARGASPG